MRYSGIILHTYDNEVVRKFSEFTLNECVEIHSEMNTERSYVFNDQEVYFSELFQNEGGYDLCRRGKHLSYPGG